MRKPTKLLTITCFIALSISANLSFSQIKFGPKVGINWIELPNNTPFIISNQQLFGYHLGVVAEIRVFEQLFIQPGVLITTKGSKYIVGNNTVSNTGNFANFQFSSLNTDIPLELLYKLDLGSFRLLLIAGPHLGYGLNGKWTTSNGTTSNVHFGNSSDSDLKPVDFGLNFGGGLEVGRIQFSSKYSMGLTSLSTLNPPGNELKFKVISLSVAYLFGKDKRGYRHYKQRYWKKNRQNMGPRKRV